MAWFWGTKDATDDDPSTTDSNKPTTSSTSSSPSTTTATINMAEEDDRSSTETDSKGINQNHGDNSMDDEESHSEADDDDNDDDDNYDTDENDTDDDDDEDTDDEGNSFHSLTTEDDDDISFIDSVDANSIDNDATSFAEETDHDDMNGTTSETRIQHTDVDDTDNGPTTQSSDSEENGGDFDTGTKGNTHQSDDDDDDDDQVPSSFWEKQGLLVLAAEHDRVDILNAVLKDDDTDKEQLMNSGVPPLHLAITFSSVNTAIALLRMGADPSVRPNVQQILEDQKSRPEDSKVDIPNIKRFDGASAWELAFGNPAYERFKAQKSKSWSLFGSSVSDSGDGHSKSSDKDSSKGHIIKPADMAPSKREGIRHAFTAEALRCVGGDEVDRLLQLVHSGMPQSIDIGGKDLYGWTVEMGALKCEEALRPAEAEKYGTECGGEGIDGSSRSDLNDKGVEAEDDEADPENGQNKQDSSRSSFKVHRPTNETIPQLRNRLDELESLAGALSTCLDNLAEEVSVCHGLLLLGGGASALASHVKNLKLLKEQKMVQLAEAEREYLNYERELADLARATGDAGLSILNCSTSQLDFHVKEETDGDGMIIETKEDRDLQEESEPEEEKRFLLAQIAATEHKTKKLRASIADLSDENARDMAEVERRGLEGGINLVRALREELRDIEFSLSEVRSSSTTFKAKIGMINAQVPKASAVSKSATLNTDQSVQPSDNVSLEKEDSDIGYSDTQQSADTTTTIPSSDSLPSEQNGTKSKVESGSKTASSKILSGDSTAIQVIRPGHNGFFPVDLWQVLLRIIGFERAAYRRGMQQQQQQQKQRQPNGSPNTFIV